MGIRSSTCCTLLAALVVSFGGGFQSGFQNTIFNPSEEAIRNFINASYKDHRDVYVSNEQWTYLWPLTLSTQWIGAFVGCIFVRQLLDKVGRKRSFYITALSLLAAVLMQFVSKFVNCWEMLTAGRLLQGTAQGLHLGIQPVYLNEISPKSIRGFIGSMTGFIMEAGFFAASLLAMPDILGNENRWPYLFLVQAAPILFTGSILPLLPESPKYLGSKGDYGGAEKALLFFGRSESEAKVELREIRLEVNKVSSASGEAEISVNELFTTPYIRKGLFLGCLLIFTASYSGALGLAYFSTNIFQTVGLSARVSQYATLGMNTHMFVGALMGGLVMDRFGRRPIILGTFGVMIFCNVLFIIFAHLARVYSMTWAAYANIVISCVLFFAHGFRPSLVSYLLTAELVPLRARSLAHSAAMMTQSAGFGTTSFIIYPLKVAFNEFSFFLHIVPLTSALIYFAFALPETKNKSTIEIIRELGFNEDDTSIKSIDSQMNRKLEEDSNDKATSKF